MDFAGLLISKSVCRTNSSSPGSLRGFWDKISDSGTIVSAFVLSVLGDEFCDTSSDSGSFSFSTTGSTFDSSFNTDFFSLVLLSPELFLFNNLEIDCRSVIYWSIEGTVYFNLNSF